MRLIFAAVAAIVLVGAGSNAAYRIDTTRYFASPAAEASSRVQLVARVRSFVASPTPRSAHALRVWLDEYNALLVGLERHDAYVYLRAEENDADIADAQIDDALGTLEDRITERVVDGTAQLGAAAIERLVRSVELTRYRYLLEDSLAKVRLQLSPAQARVVDAAVVPVYNAAADTYKRLRKSSDTIAAHQDAYAALLVSIATARNGVARVRGFSGAAQNAYFDRGLTSASVERTLAAVRASPAYARYRSVAASVTAKLAFTPVPLSVDDALAVILAAERGMGDEYSGAYAALFDPRNGRLEICTAEACDRAGFSVGFLGTESGVYYGGFEGDANSVRALAHESGHAVHRQFMATNQPVAAYNRGPAFMFESFAIFNELLLLDHRYATASTDEAKAYYLGGFLQDASFQVFGSAQETDLESAIYRGIADGTIRTAADLNALTVKTFARYDPAAVQDPDTPLYWARDRLFFTDPLYDVNYLYAGLLALKYFTDFQRDPSGFSRKYVALLKNGFNDTPAALERRFLGIDLGDESGLVANAAALIEQRTDELERLVSPR